MRVLAHAVERDGTLAGLQSVLGAAGGQLLLAEPHHGAVMVTGYEEAVSVYHDTERSSSDTEKPT